MPRQPITATAITCPGRWEDDTFDALQISIAGVRLLFPPVMALPKITAHELARQVDPTALYRTLADAINAAHVSIEVAT